MRGCFLLTIIFMCISSCAGMQNSTGHVTGVELIDYGLLNIKIEKTIDKKTTSSGKYNVGGVESVKETTTIIPALKKETFGIVYQVNGSPIGEKTVLTVKVTHPPIKNNTISTAKIWAIIGEKNSSFYTFDEEYELVEGVWTIAILDKDKVLVHKKFEVRKPNFITRCFN